MQIVPLHVPDSGLHAAVVPVQRRRGLHVPVRLLAAGTRQGILGRATDHDFGIHEDIRHLPAGDAAVLSAFLAQRRLCRADRHRMPAGSGRQHAAGGTAGLLRPMDRRPDGTPRHPDVDERLLPASARTAALPDVRADRRTGTTGRRRAGELAQLAAALLPDRQPGHPDGLRHSVQQFERGAHLRDHADRLPDVVLDDAPGGGNPSCRQDRLLGDLRDRGRDAGGRAVPAEGDAVILRMAA